MESLAAPKPNRLQKNAPPEGGARPGVGPWLWVAVVWIGVIFFSSTSLASKWAESLFLLLSGEFLDNLRHNYASYDLLHLLADKGFHVTLFCVLAILLWLAIRGIARKPRFIILCGAIIGSASEFLQSFFPDRDPALRDVLINIGGTIVGVLICLTVARWSAARRRAREA